LHTDTTPRSGGSPASWRAAPWSLPCCSGPARSAQTPPPPPPRPGERPSCTKRKQSRRPSRP